MAKIVKKQGVLFESNKLYDNQVPEWINGQLTKRGYTIRPKAALMLAEFLGTDLSKISNEIEKLAINLPQGTEITDEDIEHIYIAGTFGNYIDKHNARVIGLISDVLLEKVIFVGNAALEGARLALISQEARKETEAIVQKAEFINLSADQTFQDAFADAMVF